MTFLQRQQQGFSLVEIIVAMGIISFVTLGVTALAAHNIRVSRVALEETQVNYLLEEGVEAVKTIRDEDWSTLVAFDMDTPYYLAFSEGAWTLTLTASSVGIFQRTVTLSEVRRDLNNDISESGSIDPQTLLVAVDVSWLSGGEAQSSDLKFYITDFLAD